MAGLPRALLNEERLVEVLVQEGGSAKVRYRRAEDGDVVEQWVRQSELSEPRVVSLGALPGRIPLQQAIAQVLSADIVERDLVRRGLCPDCTLPLHEGECS